MVCNTAHLKLFQYLDGELSEEQRSELESHHASCPDCQRLADLERTFHQTYLEPLRPDPAPEKVREQVGRLLDALPDQQPRPAGWRRPSAISLLVGLAFALFGGILWLSLERPRNGTNAPLVRLVEASVVQHQKLARGILPHDITHGTPKAVEQWFKGRLDFNVSLPELTRDDLTFLGGRISHLRGFDVAALHYRVEGKDVSLFIMPLERYQKLGLGEFPKFKIVTHQGYDVIVWASHGAAYSLVSEIGGRACLVCHSPEEKRDPLLHPSPHLERGATSLRRSSAL